MADPILPRSSPGSSAKDPGALPEAWDYELPAGYDPVPRPSPPMSLEGAENHFRPWIDAFPANWEDDQSRWSRKVFELFVLS